MKKITGLYCIIFSLCLHSIVAAQPGKKSTTKPATPSMSDIQKMMKDLPTEQQAMIKNGMVKPNTTPAEPSNAALDEWDKATADAAAAIGTVTTKTIGPAGGIVKSVNGKITLNFPAGALATDTQIGIEETANTAPLACGNSFKLTPDGQVFTKPVMLTIKFTNVDIEGTAPEALYMASEVNGVWMASANTTIDAKAKTVTLPIKHFSDWGVGAFLKMVMLPQGDKKLGRGQSINFTVTTYKEIADKKAKWEEDFLKKLNELVDEMDKEDAARARDEELTKKEWKEYVDEASGGDPELEPLIREAPKTTQRHIDEIGEQKVIELLKKARTIKNQDDDLVPLVPPSVEKVTEERLLELLKKLNKFKGFKLTAWKMNGDASPVSNEMGKLKSGEYASAYYTAPLTVPLTSDRSVAISCEFVNLKSKVKFIFVTHVILTNDGWFSAIINGKTLYGHQPFDMKYLPQTQGNAGGQVTIANANYTYQGEAKGLSLLLTNASPKSFILHIPSPHLGQNVLDCKSGAGAVFATNGSVADLTEVKRVKRNSSCDETEICHSLTVNLTALNFKTGGLVSGDFQGILYADFIDGGVDDCVSKVPQRVSGKFSLSVVMDSNDSRNITIPQKN
jgi:hypothetical protein